MKKIILDSDSINRDWAYAQSRATFIDNTSKDDAGGVNSHFARNYCKRREREKNQIDVLFPERPNRQIITMKNALDAKDLTDYV